jgi:hypothetical protein
MLNHVPSVDGQMQANNRCLYLSLARSQQGTLLVVGFPANWAPKNALQ